MKRLLLILAIMCFKNGIYAIGKVDPNEQFLQSSIESNHSQGIPVEIFKEDVNDINSKNLLLEKAIKSRNISEIDSLMDYYAKKYQVYLEGETEKKPKIELDLKKQAELNEKLQEAIRGADNVKIIKLIKDGADINFIKKSRNVDWTPLLYAYRYNDGIWIFKQLLDLGADPHIGSFYNFWYSDEESENGHDKKHKAGEYILVIHNQKQDAKKLLEQVKPIKINEIKKALANANWPADVANIVCEY